MNYTIRAAVIADASAIAPHLRDADKNEIIASHGHDIENAIAASINASEASTVCLPDGTPICIFGIGGDGQGYGIPWMIGTDEMIKHRKALIRDARNWIERQLKRYPILYNYADGRNTVHINWLRHMGFTISHAPDYIGVDREVPFYLFQRSI